MHAHCSPPEERRNVVLPIYGSVLIWRDGRGALWGIRLLPTNTQFEFWRQKSLGEGEAHRGVEAPRA